MVQTIPIVPPGGVKLGKVKLGYHSLRPTEVKYPPKAETMITIKGIKK
jgi:hypothetical protein